jgi:epoxyqueuosine reductase
MPEELRTELGDQVYGCDVCQEVCPWNRGVEARRAREAASAGAEPVVSLRAWLEADDRTLRERYARLFVPRHDGRTLKRNAIVAAANTHAVELADLLERCRDSGDAVLSEPAAWALERLGAEESRDPARGDTTGV